VISPSSEYTLLSDLQSLLTEHSDKYEIEIGDDAAVRKGGNADQVILTTDLCVENVHFKLEWMSMREVGYKSMVTNLSDCASMGASPESALVQLVFPKNDPDLNEHIRELYRGFNEACTKWKFPIVGGDLSAGDHWVIGITLVGNVPFQSRTLKRKGAHTGDKLWVSGMPGRSAAGLAILSNWKRDSAEARKFKDCVDAHIRPVPRIELGMELRENCKIHAMMDLSDGLAKDARTMAFENNCGIILDIDTSHIPSYMLESAKELQTAPLDWIIQGGEEYELLFAASPAFQAASLPPLIGATCICIGEFTDNQTGLWLKQQQELWEIKSGGWNHV